MQHRFLVAIACLAPLVGGECVYISPHPEKSGRLTVYAMTFGGKPLSDVTLRFFQNGKGVQVDPQRIPYGVYSVEISTPAFGSARRDIVIEQPETSIQQHLEFGMIVDCPPKSGEISGRIVDPGDTKDMWVKAVPVRGVDGGEAAVGEAGTFLISGLTTASHVLIVTRGEKVLHQEVVPHGTARLGLTIRMPVR